MSDGRHFDKTEKSEYLRNSLIDYHKILHIDAKAPYTQLKVRLKKSKTEDSWHFEKPP